MELGLQDGVFLLKLNLLLFLLIVEHFRREGILRRLQLFGGNLLKNRQSCNDVLINEIKLVQIGILRAGESLFQALNVVL